MDEKRRTRYSQKLTFMLEKASQVSLKPTNATDLDASLYRIEVAIQAATDLAAMLVKDLGLDVSDDYHNFDNLEDQNVISKPLAEELRKANGFRNAIVHKYNRFEQEVALKRIPLVKEALAEFATIVEEKLDELEKNKN